MVDDRRIMEIVELHRRSSGRINATTLASELGAPRSTVQDSLKRLGLNRQEAFNPIAFANEMEEAFASFKPGADPIETPKEDFVELLALYPLGDPHIGSLIWKGDASENWDMKIAINQYRETFSKIINRTPKTKHAILLLGGDTLHTDNNENVTPKSKNPLQVDGRYPKVFIRAAELIVELTDMLLRQHESVEIIVLQGNHDETSAVPLSFFFMAWFRNEPRVLVDTSARMVRFRKFGTTMLSMTHGHTIKPEKMAEIMARYEPEMWGSTKFRYAHTFHLHHRKRLTSELGGCITETHQIIAPADAWHYGAGFSGSGRSQQSIIYDRKQGEICRFAENI